MIPQYTANALAQKMAQLGMPASLFNITSANESEDVVSYGATAGTNAAATAGAFQTAQRDLSDDGCTGLCDQTGAIWQGDPFHLPCGKAFRSNQCQWNVSD